VLGSAISSESVVGVGVSKLQLSLFGLFGCFVSFHSSSLNLTLHFHFPSTSPAHRLQLQHWRTYWRAACDTSPHPRLSQTATNSQKQPSYLEARAAWTVAYARSCHSPPFPSPALLCSPVRGAVGTSGHAPFLPFRDGRGPNSPSPLIRLLSGRLPFPVSHASVQRLRPTRTANKICERVH
jgi:hypothetical protein